jgi:alcohol dehydrogenase (NADP+)
MSKTTGYAAQSATSLLAPFEFERRDLREKDLLIDILYCGICHSDLHMARNEWNKSNYPIVPGHEIIGRVTKVGPKVKSYKVGDLIGIGCIIGSCQSCDSCKADLEQYCEKGFTLVFNSEDPQSGERNHGGFSKQIVVDEKYAIRIPKQFKEKDLPAVAPILCAGITTYSPLKHWKVERGTKVGIVGLGGLGHMAVQLAHALGAHVTVFTTSPNKANEARELGADEVVISKEPKALENHANSLDFILNTVAFIHDLNPYLSLLKHDGTMCLVGLPAQPYEKLEAYELISKRKALAGSLIGGIKETQELLDFCAKHHVLAKIELIPINKINEAFERMIKNDVKYRFVIDMSSL